jgi:hypothetical protein
MPKHIIVCCDGTGVFLTDSDNHRYSNVFQLSLGFSSRNKNNEQQVFFSYQESPLHSILITTRRNSFLMELKTLYRVYI